MFIAAASKPTRSGDESDRATILIRERA